VQLDIAGMFCSVKCPLPSMVVVNVVPLTVTVNVTADVLNSDAPDMPRTVPDRVVPVDAGAGPAFDTDESPGAVGDTGPWLPHATTKRVASARAVTETDGNRFRMSLLNTVGM
jgi:hypothetical protein